MGSDRFNHWEFGIAIRLMNKVHTYRHHNALAMHAPPTCSSRCSWQTSPKHEEDQRFTIFSQKQKPTMCSVPFSKIKKSYTLIFGCLVWFSPRINKCLTFAFLVLSKISYYLAENEETHPLLRQGKPHVIRLLLRTGRCTSPNRMSSWVT